MTLFQKLGEVISANINNAIEKSENPSVMSDYYIKKAEDELEKTRMNTAEVMADRKDMERTVESTKKSIDEMTKYAEAALKANNREDARKFLESRANFESNLAKIEPKLEALRERENTLLALCDKLSTSLDEMRADGANIKADVSISGATKLANGVDVNSTGKARARFKKMQDKAIRMVDVANSETQIIEASNSVNNLKNKYNPDRASIDEELDKMAAKLASN